MVAAAGIVLGAAGLSAAIGVPLGIENRKKPKLEIKPVQWAAGGPTYPMTFASVQAINKPIRGPLGMLINRDVAEACELYIDFFTWGDKASRTRVFGTISGRWDGHPEPWQPVFGVLTSDSISPGRQIKIAQTGTQYDPSLISAQQDISVGSDRGRVSVAVLRDGEAFAFSNESYMHMTDHLGKPDWKLNMGSTYRVEIRVTGSNVDHTSVFKLEYLSANFSSFQLQPVKD
jgi:hypothetical protein